MWAAIANTLIGLWMMMAPALLGYPTPAANNTYIIAPLVITFAITAIWEVNRSIRYIILPLGLWLAAAPFILGYEGIPRYHDLVAGITIAALSLVKGKIEGNYGGGWRSLFQKHPAHSSSQVKVTGNK